MRSGCVRTSCAPFWNITCYVILGSLLKSFPTPKARLIHFRGMTCPLPSYILHVAVRCKDWTCFRLLNFELWSFGDLSWNALWEMSRTLIYALFRKTLFDQQKEAGKEFCIYSSAVCYTWHDIKRWKCGRLLIPFHGRIHKYMFSVISAWKFELKFAYDLASFWKCKPSLMAVQPKTVEWYSAS
jgi:hypothetical protein